MRHLLGVRRRRADEVLPDAGRQGARRDASRPSRARPLGRAVGAAEGVPQDRRQPVRLLHPRHGDGGDRGDPRQSVRRARGDQGAARRQHLPLHRLSEDLRRGRARARRANGRTARDRARRGRAGGRPLHRRQRAPHRRAQQGVGRAQICRRHGDAGHAAHGVLRSPHRACAHRVDRHVARPNRWPASRA